MAGERNPESLRAETALTFQWQPFEDVLSAAMSAVMPGRGLRQYQVKRKPPTGTVKRRQLTQDEQIQSGRRSLAYSSVRAFLESGRAERATIDGVDCIRWAERRRQADETGQCPTCHRPLEATESKPTTPSPRRRPAMAVVVDMAEHRNRRSVDRLVGT